MKYWLNQLVITTIFLGAALAQDPVKTLPQAYQSIFENEYVRVQRVHYAPHVKLPEHNHPAFATAYVYLNDAGPVIYKHHGVSYGAVTRPPVKAGGFRLYKGVKETHEVESLSDTPSDFLRIEFKTAVGADSNTLRGKYFRVEYPVGENFTKVQFENAQVRVTRLICAIGKPCDVRVQSSEPALIVALLPAQFKAINGSKITFQWGQPQWLAAGQQLTWTNTANAPAELLRFEFKTLPTDHPLSEVIHEHPNVTEQVSTKAKAEASELLKQGAALEAKGKVEDSIAAHEKALTLNPALVQAHINLISLYGRTNNTNKADEHFRAALAINPDLPDLHYNLGVLRFGQDRLAEAAEAFQHCLQLNPYYAEAHFNYAAIIERDGKFDEAASHYRKAIANKTGYRMAHFALGRILVHQEKWPEAVEQLQQTLTPDDEETPRYLYALGATYIRAGDRAKGEQYLREALKRATALQQTQIVNSIERDLKLLER